MARCRVALVSLGCPRTLVDSEVALGSLREEGYEIVREVERSDVAVVNTCGFIEEAKRESVETILELCELKKKGRLAAVVVLGCLAQRYGKELRREFREVDGIIGTDSFGNLPEVLRLIREKKTKAFEVHAKPRYLLDENSPREALTPPHFAYIKISEGCLNACSYCVIPRMKGAHRSRSIESVLNEIRKLAAQRPLSEVNLIGQDTAAYGHDLDRTFQLPVLLNKIAAMGLVPWVRFLYAHPAHVTEELIGAMARNRAICRYVDFPIEHSHDAVLARMNRGTSRAKIEWGIRTLRKAIPGISLRTTVIVGFPGETEEEFRDLLSFLKETRFERLGAFRYSREEGSRSFNHAEQIPPGVKEERFHAVMAQQREISLELNEAQIGRTVTVLVDEEDGNEAGVYRGRTEHDAPEVDNEVIVRSSRRLSPGEFVSVKITDAMEYDLVGDLEDSGEAAA